jgi:hypothetical protein
MLFTLANLVLNDNYVSIQNFLFKAMERIFEPGTYPQHIEMKVLPIIPRKNKEKLKILLKN